MRSCRPEAALASKQAVVQIWRRVPADSQTDRALSGTVHALQRYLDRQGLLDRPTPEPPTPVRELRDAYEVCLRDVRGLANKTVGDHLRTARAFLSQLGEVAGPGGSPKPSASDVEVFMRQRGSRVGRGSLQYVAGELRGCLRFLAGSGTAPAGLDDTGDPPRLDRGEQLSRALPWRTVRAVLRANDRSTPLGLRDHAMLSLIATYALRANEVVALTLEDSDWRAGQLRIVQRKPGGSLRLPLTDTIGDILLGYLRDARPTLPFRQVFLRARAPSGALKATAITDAFARWRIRSQLPIPPQGPHCLCHAYAVHLLRCGTPLKTIGDLLGHRRAESTCVYLRLAIEDLREVPLDLPVEVRS